MYFILFSCITVLINIQFSCSDEDNNFVYKNLYGDKDFHYSFLGSAAKLTTGGLRFVDEANRLLAEETKDTTPKFDEEYDFIVVGAGSAGCTLAARLSEMDNVTVLLIEAGGKENLLYDVPLLLDALQFSYLLNWQYETEPSESYCVGSKGRCLWPIGRVMGGSSVLNYMIATRGHPLDYDGWADLGNTGWSYNDTFKYFKKLEEIGIPELREDKKYHNTDGPVYISYPPFHTPLAEAFLKAGEEMGYPIIDYNGEKRIGYSYIQYTAKNGERMSANRAYLYPSHKRKNLFVSKTSLVTKVLIDPQSRRAYGVKFLKSGRTIRVKARKEVILTAGAIGSPKLLMLSGIGPADHLKDMKIELVQDAPVGKNLMDQIVYVGLVFLVDQPVAIKIKDVINPLNPYLSDYLKKRREGPVTVAGGVEAFSFINVDEPNNLDAYPNVEFLFAGASLAALPPVRYLYGISDEYWKGTFANLTEAYTWSIFPMILHPRSRGRLLLRNKDPKSKPKLVANYFEDPEDLRVMIKGIRAAIEMGKTKAMQRFHSRLHEARIPGCEQHEYDSDAYWECAARAFSYSIYHQSGTCKMAPENDDSGVVNPRLQVKGVKGLRVADASIMPVIITGHTHIPVVMIAEKLADMIKEDWGSKK